MTPASLTNDQWHWRWVYQTRGRSPLLHRIGGDFKVGKREPSESFKGVTVCGLSSSFNMPGILSRMGARRCRKCCQVLGIPQGNGSPYNDDSLPKEQREA